MTPWVSSPSQHITFMTRCQKSFVKRWWICVLVPGLSQSSSIGDGEVKQHLIAYVQLSALTSSQFCLITSELSTIHLTNIWLLHGLPTQFFTSKCVHTLTSHYWVASGHCGLLPECLCWILKWRRIQRQSWLTQAQKNPIICVASMLQFVLFALLWRKQAVPGKSV